MLEQIAADIAGHRDIGPMRGIAADAPHQVVGRDQATEQREGAPDQRITGLMPAGDDVDQVLQAVLRGHTARDGDQDGKQDGEVPDRMAPHIMEQKLERPAPQRGQAGQLGWR